MVRTRRHTIRGMVVYFTAIAGIIVLVTVRPPHELAIVSIVGLAILWFGSLWWVAKRDSVVINGTQERIQLQHQSLSKT